MTAKPDGIECIARGVLRAGSRVLLCRAKRGYFYLPGGHVELGEQASESLAREIQEELGWTVRVGDPLLACEVIFEHDGRVHHEWNVVFHVEHFGVGSTSASAEPVSREPDISFEWVELANLVDLDLRPASIKAWLVTGGNLGKESSMAWISEPVPGLRNASASHPRP